MFLQYEPPEGCFVIVSLVENDGRRGKRRFCFFQMVIGESTKRERRVETRNCQLAIRNRISTNRRQVNFIIYKKKFRIIRSALELRVFEVGGGSDSAGKRFSSRSSDR